MRDCSNASQCKVFQLCPLLIHISDLLSDSLLLDDIEDSSILRRGLPVAHKIFGEVMISPLSILHLWPPGQHHQLRQLCDVHRPRENLSSWSSWGCQRLHTAAAGTAQGTGKKMKECERRLTWNTQGMEIYWRDNFLCPTEEEYRLMISRKTGMKSNEEGR